MLRAIGLSIVAAAVLFAMPAAAADPGVAHVDAIVTDARGAVVKDLTADDFALLVKGTPQSLDSVRLASPDAPRHFAIFLDEFHVADGPAVARVRELLIDFVERELGPRDLAMVVKPLDSLLELKLISDRQALTQAIGAFEGRKGNYQPRSDFERNYVAGTPERIEATRSQVATSVIAALATYLNGLGTGRKTIVVVSEGFAAPPSRRDSALPTIQSAIRAANQATASIYSIHPRAFDGQPVDVGNDAGVEMLRTLAEETNGRLIQAPQDLQQGMQQVVDDASAYYLLTFKPADQEDPNRFREVELRVNRPSVAVRARRGYWPASASDLFRVRMASKAPEAPPVPMRPPRSSPLIRSWFGVARAADGAVRLNFVWEPAPRVPGDRSKPELPSVIGMKAMRPDGTSVFEGDVAAGVPLEDVATEPGRLRVELAIRDAEARLLDTDVRDVVVGGLTGAVEVGTAAVMRSRNAREYRELLSNRSAAPVATREFSRTERLLIRIPVYSSRGEPKLVAALKSAFGATLRELEVAPAPSPGVYEIDLPLANLAAGEYAVEIQATSVAGDAKDVVRFRVTP